MHRSSNLRTSAVPALSFIAAVIGVAACYGPTEVRVEVTRDAPCAAPGETRTGVFVGAPGQGSPPPAADTLDCTTTPDGASIGSLVVVPSGDRKARVTVEVALSFDPKRKAPEQCLANATGCIVARRSFAFIEHTSRTLPIRLYEDCRDKTCATGSTCVAGQCVSDDVDAPTFCDTASGCGLPPADAGVDAPPLPDAAPPPDAPAPAACAGPRGDGILLDNVPEPAGKLVAGPDTIYWPLAGTGAGTGSGVGVGAVAKSGALVPGVATTSPVTSIAVGPTGTLWLVDTNQVERVSRGPGASPVPTTFLLQGAAAVALGGDAFIVAPQGLFTLAAAAVSPTQPALFALNNYNLGNKVAVNKGHVYVLSTNILARVAVANPADIQSASAAGLTDLAAGAAEVFWGEASPTPTSGGAIRVFRDAAPGAEYVTSAFAPRYLAHDGAQVYWTDAVSSVALQPQRRIWKLVGATPTAVSIPEAPAIIGLAVDAQCVYYWSASNTLGSGAIRVAPK